MEYMKYEEFEKYIALQQKLMERSHSLSKLGIDTLEYNEMFYNLIEVLTKEIFSEEQRDWIDWYLFERVSPTGEILKAWDKDDNEICYDIKSLWKEIAQ